MKAFLGTLAVLAAVTLGWNYWAMHRVQAPGVSAGRYQSPGFARGGRGRGPSGPTSEVTGVVRMAGGVAHGAHIDLVRGTGGGGGIPRVYAGQEALGDGRFTFTGVMPDRYWAVARTELDPDPMRPGEGQPQTFYGLAEVVTDGEHPAHVSLQLRPATLVTGRVVIEPFTAMASRDFSLLTISLRPVDAQARAALATGDASAGLTAEGKY